MISTAIRKLLPPLRRFLSRKKRRRIFASPVVLVGLLGFGSLLIASAAVQPVSSEYVVFAYNELGMHCMQQDFSEMMILPPFNTLRAQVVLKRTGEDPSIVTTGIAVRYAIPANTHSSDKCNFWSNSHALLGVDLAPDVGLAGFGMAGTMAPVADLQFAATGIPATPVDDTGRENPYPLATVSVERNGAVVGTTQAVVPVSWEMSCNLCHNTPGQSVATTILMAHDRLHNTTLIQQKPVFCAQCHSDAAVGAPGLPGLKTLSGAMHTSHSTRMAAVNLVNECYACHPGFRTQCQRDVHSLAGMTCNNCHTSMAAVGSPTRRPWIDEPRCATCHTRPGFEFEQAGKNFRDSVGHKGIACMSCHGSPHAITPAANAADNLQAIVKQGHAGTINTCSVCHSSTPTEPFPHVRGD